MIRLCEGLDYVTRELSIRLVADEELHRTLFVGFVREYRKTL